MLVSMKDIGRQLNEMDIAALEKKLGKHLTREYKAFLMQYNGGRPNPDTFPIQADFSGGDMGSIQFFLGIYQPIESNNLEWAYNAYVDDLPLNIIPIALIGYEDDAVCLSIGGSDQGYVYYWDSQGEGSSKNDNDLYLVATTLQKFLDNLYEYVPSNETESDRIVRENDVNGLDKLISSGYELEITDEHGRTMIENAAIHNITELKKN